MPVATTTTEKPKETKAVETKAEVKVDEKKPRPGNIAAEILAERSPTPARSREFSKILARIGEE